MDTAEKQAKIGLHTIYGAPEGQDARILAERARALMPQDRVLIHVALDDARLSTLRGLLEFFAPDVKVIEFSSWDCLPYDRISPNGEIVARRVAALSRILAWSHERERYPRLVLTTINAVGQRLMPKTALEGASLSVSKGKPVDMAAFQRFLTQNGYIRVETVREAGEYAMRGGIIDIFPPAYAEPLRLDLFGDEVESIRAFDPLSQRTHTSVQTFSLQPVGEIFLDEVAIERFRGGYRAAFGVVSGQDPLYAAISEGRRYNGMDHWQPLFYEKMDTLFDYLPSAVMIFDHHALSAHDERMTQIYDFYQARKTLEAAEKKRGKDSSSFSGTIYHPLPVELLYITGSEWDALTQDVEIFSPFGPPDESQPVSKKGRDFSDVRALPDGDVMGELRRHLASLHAARKKIVIACYSEGSRQRLQGMMAASGIPDLVECNDANDLKKLGFAQTGFAVLGLEHGFISEDLAVLTEADILGDRLVRKSGRRKKADNFLREVSSLDEGDLVVHVEHGIGRFLSLETLSVGKTLHDCLKIEYAGGDKLYVPVENIEVLSRFGSEDGSAQLDRLGGAGWQARKARVKKDLMVMAEGLLKIAAARLLKTTQPITVSPELYNEFASRFPYAETEDQERAIQDVLDSLAGDHPMDRLVCGDVGFGKTEVALRAAYVAAMDGAQVAVVVPTTLLARQHYNNFQKRFAGTGLRIGQLSRMVNAKDAKSVREGLAEGWVNIVIGTHALFASSLKFKNLGLLIVDEEQRFGVKQKEKLKEISENVHVLTLTATPIPRTLQMSLTGVKEMSLITTPPVDRLAVRTFVLPVDTLVIREALLREHYRGGQSFYVCPRISDMADLERMLKELVPDIKVISAHGQMTPTDLEDRMTAFYDGQYDVLLATNIIESGIDIPTANTMIVHRADMFGLAQLYQIRGRIGRSRVRAYAYLTYPPLEKLGAQAQKRLEVMETLDTLGSGFQLASHDMDIRGAGNLLGEQQSGHIREVGVELYQQMLEDAVALARQRGEAGGDMNAALEEGWSPQINVGTSVLIPEIYVPDLGVRMSLYRRLSNLETPEDMEEFAAELIDRFGDLPEEVKNLLDIVAIKQLCKRAGVGSVEAGPKGAVIGYHKDTPPNLEGLMRWMVSKGGAVKLRPDQKIVAVRGWEDVQKRVRGVKNLMAELAELSA
ncbi:MAG: transcription-repair coupling factor [Alphaproteobacteria bacterium]|nr:transcription-repair coupling factor [Alphaproteobacteria bacterium]